MWVTATFNSKLLAIMAVVVCVHCVCTSVVADFVSGPMLSTIVHSIDDTELDETVCGPGEGAPIVVKSHLVNVIINLVVGAIDTCWSD